MENHPIPQDVTGFKFKLIGSVTVKQFLYILGGGILAVICFILPVSYVVRIPLAALFGGVGAMLAFVPIEGRPMDVMIKNFLKALPAENQFIYRKRGANNLITEFFAPSLAIIQKTAQTQKPEANSLDTKRALLYSALKKNYKPDEREEAVLTNINNYLNEAQHTASPQVQNLDTAPKNSATQIVMPTAIPKANISEAIKIVTAPSQIPKETAVARPTPISSADSKPVFEDIHDKVLDMGQIQQRQTLQGQAPQNQIPQDLPQNETVIPQDVTVVKPEMPKLNTVAPNETQNVTTVSSDQTLKAGFPQLPDTPNVVLGIIKDPRGRILPNILVEIMDTQGIPVRTFKTNALGQFAAATPLPDGEYNILLEDPRKQHEFEQIHITLGGNLFEPLEIFSVDQREKLRRELFGAGAGAQV